MKKFKEFLTEARELPEFDAIRPMIVDVISNGLGMVIKGQVVHWSTNSLSHHEALSDFYMTLKDYIDNLAEASISVGFNVEDLVGMEIAVNDMSIQTFEEDLMAYRGLVTNTISYCGSEMSNIQDILTNIVSTIDTMSYKLTLV